MAAGGEPALELQSVAVDAWGQVVANGNFVGEIALGGTTFPGSPSPNTNLLGLKLDGTGAFVWGKAIPNLAEGTWSVTPAPADGFAVSGYVSGEGVDLGAGTVVDTGAGRHVFVARWSP